jgi:hypothetical protein
MIYRLSDCITNKVINAPVCVAHLEPEQLFGAMESVYKTWEEKNGLLGREREQEIFR